MDYETIYRDLHNAERRQEVPLQVLARFFHNVERIANAQEIAAGLRPRPSPLGNGVQKN